MTHDVRTNVDVAPSTNKSDIQLKTTALNWNVSDATVMNSVIFPFQTKSSALNIDG